MHASECLFLEAHNMADMCFVIVSTASSRLAYEGRLSSPIPPRTLKMYALQFTGYSYINRTTKSSDRHPPKHSPFDDDGHMEYLFLGKRH